MNCLEWDDGLQVGVKQIDEQHKHLFDLLDKIASISIGHIQTNKTSHFSYTQADKIGLITDELIDQVILFFNKDEHNMKELGYPGLALQEQQHLEFVKMLLIELDLRHLNKIPTIDLLEHLASLLRNHIMTVDKKYAAYLNSSINKSPAVIIDADNQQRGRQMKELETVIAELKSTQQQMVQQEKMAMVGQLTAGIAHEINNPISFISSNIVLLGKYCERLLTVIEAQQEALLSVKPDSHQTEQLKTVRHNLKIERVIRDIPEMIRETMEGVDRIKCTVNALKNFSRMEDSEMQLTDINQCLESTLNIANSEMTHKTMIKREYGELPQILCYPQQLNHVFMNLLVNAHHATDTEGEITVRSWHSQERIFISFSDTGCGIPEHQLLRIFEPFFTTREAGRGTGLGLSISNEIIRNHGGEIRVDSEVGHGSTFTVSISLERGSAPFMLSNINAGFGSDDEK